MRATKEDHSAIRDVYCSWKALTLRFQVFHPVQGVIIYGKVNR